MRTVGVIMLGVAMLAGCAAEDGFQAHAQRADRERRTYLAQLAAATPYPKDQKPAEDLRATVLVDREKQQVRLVNPADQALRDINLWVNGQYMQRVDAIAPRAVVTLDRNYFYDANGDSLGASRATIDRVEIQTADGRLHRALGPVYE